MPRNTISFPQVAPAGLRMCFYTSSCSWQSALVPCTLTWLTLHTWRGSAGTKWILVFLTSRWWRDDNAHDSG